MGLPSVMPLAVFSEGDLANLLSNRLRTIMCRLRGTVRSRTAGELEAVRWMQSNLPSVWMRTRGICRYVGGTWSSW